MPRLIGCLVAVFMLTACGDRLENPSSLAATGFWTDYNIHDPGVAVIAGGVNNGFSGYRVTAKILAGLNECKANRVDVALVAQRVGNEIWIVGKRRDRKPAGTRCSDEVSPRYLDAVIRVRAERRDYPTVILKSVERIGNDVEVAAYLDR